MRTINTTIPTFDELESPVLKDVCMSKRGIMLFVGATGAGKVDVDGGATGYRNENGATGTSSPSRT